MSAKLLKLCVIEIIIVKNTLGASVIIVFILDDGAIGLQLGTSHIDFFSVTSQSEVPPVFIESCSLFIINFEGDLGYFFVLLFFYYLENGGTVPSSVVVFTID